MYVNNYIKHLNVNKLFDFAKVFKYLNYTQKYITKA